VDILAGQIAPYFYYLPDEKDNPDSIRDRLMNARREFPKIGCEYAETKKLVGHTRIVLKVTCSNSQVLT